MNDGHAELLQNASDFPEHFYNSNIIGPLLLLLEPRRLGNMTLLWQMKKLRTRRLSNVPEATRPGRSPGVVCLWWYVFAARWICSEENFTAELKHF